MAKFVYIIDYQKVSLLDRLSKNFAHLQLLQTKIHNLNYCSGLYLFKTDVDAQRLTAAKEAILELGFDLIITDKPIKCLPKLLVFDMDSTLIPIEVIDKLAAFAGVEPQVSHITELAMQGELDFNQSLISRVKLLEGLSVAAIERLSANLCFNPGVEDLCHYMLEKGASLAIASGGFLPLAKKLQSKVPFQFISANQLAVDKENNKLTGQLVGEIVNAEYKATMLENWSKQLSLALTETMAIGDGANDLLMLEKAGLGLAYHAKPKVNTETNAVLKYGEMNVLIDWFDWLQE